MFRRLRLKLAVLYAGLFCAALLMISVTAYFVIANNAQRDVREQLQATSAVFDRLWEIRFGQLQGGAELSARDYGFRQAVATQDVATIRSALQNLRQRLDADLVFLVTPDGHAVSDDLSRTAPTSDELHRALETDDAPTGVLMADGVLHQAVTAPIFAPNLLGWVVVGVRLDQTEMTALEALSAIPLQAVVLTRGRSGWASSERNANSRQREALDLFIEQNLNADAPQPELLHAFGGDSIALVKPLRALDGAPSALLIRYPMAMAMAPYRALFSTMIAVGVIGLGFLLAATWLLANGITRPISTLEAAARRLQEGRYDPVEVTTNDEIARLSQSFNAMAASIQEREARITHLALSDNDTDLPNRLSLERRLSAKPSVGAKTPVFVAAIGIDRFTQVRGAIGYSLANVLMQQLGERLMTLAPNAPVGRLSSDVLGLAFLAHDEAAAQMRMRTLAHAMEQPVSVQGQVVDVEVTIGLTPARDAAPNTLIDRASIALEQARAARGKTAFFDETAYGDPARNLSLMGEMRRALTNGEIRLAHQPKFSLRNQTICGVETLVRWKHPTRGMIAPDLFVPMAEETGHIRVLTDWVLAQTLREQEELAVAGWPLPFSINVSGRLLGDRDFARAALHAIKAHSHGICFEITETAIIDNAQVALGNIDVFSRNGVRLSIDDYGSGLSSLAYLKQLPVHELKIDKLFIQNLTSKRDALLVRSTIDLAHGLGLVVTAEGVESPAALALLSAMGCDMAQGYVIARPSPLNELLTILNDTRRMEFLRHPAQSVARAQ